MPISACARICCVICLALADQLVVGFGYDVAFLTLTGIAAFGALLFWIYMPETRPVEADVLAGDLAKPAT
jgi:hypothetical protein